MIRFLLFFSIYCVLFSIVKAQQKIATNEPINEPVKPTTYPLWAHFHWVWLHANEVNAKSTQELIDDYKSRGISVGATNIDSAWMTKFNNFEANTELFPNLEDFIKSMHDQNIRVIFWATSMINTDDPSYLFVKEKDWFIKDSYGHSRPLHWWHGHGSLIDYWNPDAKNWWHKQLDKILLLGADGFKTDGTDPYLLEYELFGGAYAYNNQSISYHDYASAYYEDFFDYTREIRGNSGLIMSRPVDCMLDKVVAGCWPYSSQRVVLSGWVGDDDATFEGLRGCADKVIFSAWLGYIGYGCDIGGYRGSAAKSEPMKEVFIRSAQFNAFLPLMENGGNGEHRPWLIGCTPMDNDCDQSTETAETLEIYSKFVLQHHRLAPLLLTKGNDALDNSNNEYGHHTLITPLALKPNSNELNNLFNMNINNDNNLEKRHDWSKRPFANPSSHNYLLADDILVAPIVTGLSFKDEYDTSKHSIDIDFPEGNDWISWWYPNNKDLIQKGGSNSKKIVPLNMIPVYVRKGALLGLALTPDNLPELGKSMPVIYEWFSPSTGNSANAYSREEITDDGSISGTRCEMSFINDVIKGQYSKHSGSGGFKIHGITKPINISMTDGCSNTYDKGTLNIVCTDMSQGAIFEASGVKELF